MPLPLSRASIFADGLDHSECIAAHPDGTFFAGGENGQIYRISADGKSVKEIAQTGGFVLGVAVAPDGKWVAICDLKKKCVLALCLTSLKLETLASGLSIPNHLAFARDGSLFFTDSGEFRKVSGRIFRIGIDCKVRVWHAGPFNFANGIAIGPKHDAVYVVCTWLPGVERIEIKPDGSAGKRSVYVKLPDKVLPDGLAFDALGNLYVTCYTPARIYKFTPRKKLSVLIEDWEAHMLSNPTNIAFGGKRFDQLFAANLGRWHITKIDLGIKGHRLTGRR